MADEKILFKDAPVGATFILAGRYHDNYLLTARFLKTSNASRPTPNSRWMHVDLRKWIEAMRSFGGGTASPINHSCRIDSESLIIVVGQAWLPEHS